MMQMIKVMSEKYKETKRLLRKAMQERQLVLFVGAGASVDAGMPLWKTAIKQIAEKLNLDKDRNLDNLIVPQYYYNARGRKEYTQLMREIFHYYDKLYPGEVHKAIMQFDSETIITTNYDHLIEQAAEDNGEFLQVISQDLDLPYRKSGKELIKMHGDFGHDNFVLKEDDYLHYHKNFKLIENYVKSLIGTKTVLFLGYSLNDPDVKHIFSWVKEILDEHFQRAYLIVTGRRSDQNEVEYFRHLGVNLIYAAEIFDESDIGKTDHSKQLLQTLYYILDDEERQKGVVESLYDSLKPFASLNYTYRKYIDQAFQRLRNKINERITLRVENNNYVEYSDDLATEEDKAFFEELGKVIDGDSHNAEMQTIADALKKSSVKGIRSLVRNGVKYLENKKKFESIEEPEWIEAIINFDYEKLNRIKEYNSKILSESKPELYLQQAYICSFLGDYLSAFYCLDNAATYFYRKREYAWYYISVWNKRNVAQIIQMDFFYHAGIDQKTLDAIKQEFDEIDLDKILQSIPDLGHEHNQFLRNLKDFKFASDLFYDVFSNSLKSNAQATESYFMFVGFPAYAEIRQQVYDYYRYGAYNCLQVDRYRENNEIFNLFARSMLASASAPDKEMSGESIFGNLGNIHAESLNAIDIHLILRYIDASKLRKMFREFGINIIEVSEDCREYLEELIKCIPAVFNLNLFSGRDIFWRYLCFVSHIKLDASLATIIVHVLTELKDREYADNRRDSLQEFISTIYSQELYSDEALCGDARKLIARLLELIIDNSERLMFYRNPITSLIAFCKEGGVLFDDAEHINGILAEEYNLLLPSVYTGSSDHIRGAIKQYFSEWECQDCARGYITYAELVLAEIVDTNAEIEKRAFDFVVNHYKNKQKELEKGMRSYSDADSVENYLVNLYLADKIIDKDRLKKAVTSGDDAFSKWLIDAETYDYDSFDLNWLTHCYPSLIKKIAGNEKVRHSIITVYKEKYPSKQIDKKTNEIMIKYFI